jgi:hypothetical protein
MFVQRKSGIVGDLPQMAVGIGEVACIAAPEDALAGPDDLAPGGRRCRENLFDRSFSLDIEPSAVPENPSLESASLASLASSARPHTDSTTPPASKKATPSAAFAPRFMPSAS